MACSIAKSMYRQKENSLACHTIHLKQISANITAGHWCLCGSYPSVKRCRGGVESSCVAAQSEE